MPFEDDFGLIWSYGIHRAFSHLPGWECTRADDVKKLGVVMKDVLGGIEQAQLVVADLTGNNPNVFYELGHAHASAVPHN
jgi:hypothetical protein